jgi:hypothetical protein
MLVFILAGLTPGAAFAQGPSPQETWVLQQVAAGRVADLKERFGEDETARTIRGRFVEALLTDEFSGFKPPRGGIYLLNAIIPDIFSLQYATVEQAVFLEGCQFRGLVNCGGAHFKKTLDLKQAVFSQAADFHYLKVDLDAYFREAVFTGPADFGAARIEGNLVFEDARFTGQDRDANFNGLKAGGSLSLQNAVFEGGVDLTGARLGAELNAVGARFVHPEKKVSCTGVKVGRVASFDQARFQGPVFLGDSEIGGTLSASGARFESAAHGVLFTGLKVGAGALFGQTVFKGPVNFSNTAIAGGLYVDGARFENKEQAPQFSGLKADNASFLETVFQGGATMVGAGFKNLMFAGAADAALHYPLLNLDGAVVDYSLIIGDLNLDVLLATRLQVKGPTILKNLKVGKEADLRDSSLFSLKMINVAWPQQADRVWLEGLTYQSVSAGEGPGDWAKLLAWIDHSRLDTRNYSQLETFFRQGGYQDRADTIHIQGRRRVALEQWWRPDNLATLIFWDALAGYGKKPGRTFWISLAIVLLGMLFFDPKNFDPTFLGGWTWLLNGNVWRTRVVRFFLSLDEFLPGVDLGLARLWQISKISYPTLLYYHFHKISGWILVPIGLAAVFSQFK